MRIRLVASLLAAGLVLAAVPSARATIPVIDIASISQLITQVRTLQSQLTTAESQLLQAQNAFKAITGSRGMELLLSGQNRNYLPSDWASLAAVLNATSQTYAALATSVSTQASANAVLSNAQLSQLPPNAQSEVLAARQAAALLQTLSRTALQTTSTRFTTLQTLINAIPAASDEKGALDLHARISAEQAMLANDQAKLNALFQTTQAEHDAQAVQQREQAIRDVGSLRRLPAMGL